MKNPKTGYLLRFDFAIFDHQNKLSFLIEFDGRQHYTGLEAKWSHSAAFEELQSRDLLKDEYCKQHNIILKRIPYFRLSTLSYENIMNNTYTLQ